MTEKLNQIKVKLGWNKEKSDLIVVINQATDERSQSGVLTINFEQISEMPLLLLVVKLPVCFSV